MAALAIGDEQSAFAPPDVLQPQAEDFAAAQPGEQHRVDHRPIPILPEGRDQLDHVVVVDDLGQVPDRANQRHHPPIASHRGSHRHAPLHRVVIQVTERAQVRIEPRDRRQATPDR